jgi:putative transposase
MRIFPNSNQRQTLKLWLETNRWLYNEILDELNKDHVNHSKQRLRELGHIKNEEWMKSKKVPKRMKNVPYEIRDCVIQDITKAYASLKAKEKKSKGKFKFKGIFKFRKKKELIWSCGLRSRQLNCKTNIGNIWPKLFGTVKDRSVMKTEKNKTLPLEFKHDCRLLYQRKTGYYYLCIPISIESKLRQFNGIESETQGFLSKLNDLGLNWFDRKENIISIDPGERCFGTCYDLNGFIFEWGKETRERLRSLNRKAGRLEKKSRSSKGRHKRRIAAVSARIRNKAIHSVEELHRKFALWLCRYYKIILLPKFDVQNMVRRKPKKNDKNDYKPRKINRKVAYNMVKLSHYKFRSFLMHKAEEYGNKVVICNERCTTRTCGNCGLQNLEVGGKEIFICKNGCKTVMGRDHNAARNILIKYLIDNEITTDDASGIGGCFNPE